MSDQPIETKATDELHQFIDEAKQLIEHFGQLHKIVSKGPLDQVLELKAATFQLNSFERHRRLNVVTAVIYGPSGAGKSTLFRLLTKKMVPVGVLKPTTYSSAAAVPNALLEQMKDQDIKSLFPDWQPEQFGDDKMDKMNQCLSKKDGPTNHLCVMGYDPPADTPMHVVLLDAPDFNTICTNNRKKAENLLMQANVVIFLTSGETYADGVVFAELAKCCQHAAVLQYLITKTDEVDAKTIWNDVSESIAQGSAAFGPSVTRADGIEPRAFLSSSSVYCVPPSKSLTLTEYLPISGSTETFLSELFGVDGPRVIFRSLGESLKKLITKCRTDCNSLEEIKHRLDQKLKEIQHDIEAAAKNVVNEDHFPYVKLIRLVTAECAKHEPILLPYLTWPAWKLLNVIGVVVGRRNGPATDGSSAPEKTLCDKEADRLIEVWRNRYPDERTNTGVLAANSTAAALGDFQGAALLNASSGWEDSVKMALITWASENPAMVTGLAVGKHMAIALGLGLVIADACTGGWGTMGALALWGGLPAAIAPLIAWLQKWKLDKVATNAKTEWFNERRHDISNYFDTQLVKSLFFSWNARKEDIAKFEIKEVRMLCDSLEQRIKQQMTEVANNGN